MSSSWSACAVKTTMSGDSRRVILFTHQLNRNDAIISKKHHRRFKNVAAATAFKPENAETESFKSAYCTDVYSCEASAFLIPLYAQHGCVSF
jgi:hypothetical protein